MSTPPLPSALPSPSPSPFCEPREIADVLLVAALQHRAAAVTLEPLETSPNEAVHRVTLERGCRPVAAGVLEHGLGDAVIARLALMSELNLLSSRPQTGRTSVRAGDRSLELFVTLRPSGLGLGAELRFFEDLSDPQSVANDEVPAVPHPLPEGYVLGSYTIERALGSGGMGVVYSAQHRVLPRRVAIKVLRRSVMREDPDSVRRFVREARTASRLAHPSIVHVSDIANLPDGRPYIVMEHVGGTDLGEVIENDGSLWARRAVRITRNIAEALHAAHSAGVVHRDLSAPNVFVLEHDRIKLVDFGAAVRVGDEELVPDGPPGMVIGTPSYMAPEQALGQECTPRSDLYSVGVILFEMLAGDVPFVGDSAGDVARQHVHEPAPAVCSPREILPLQLEQMVERLLRKDPRERFQSAAELVAELNKIEDVLERPGWRKWLPM